MPGFSTTKAGNYTNLVGVISGLPTAGPCVRNYPLYAVKGNVFLYRCQGYRNPYQLLGAEIRAPVQHNTGQTSLYAHVKALGGRKKTRFSQRSFSSSIVFDQNYPLNSQVRNSR